MRKKLLSLALTSAFVMLLSGCSGKLSNETLKKEHGIQLSYQGQDRAYAHMEDGKKLKKITFSSYSNDKKTEAIVINTYGFSPNYNPNFLNKEGTAACNVVWKEDKKEFFDFCRSYYNNSTVLGTAGINLFWTVGFFGLNIVTLHWYNVKEFNDNKLLNVVKNNKLEQVKTKIAELNRLENEHTKELGLIYDEEVQKYNENIKNIEFKYSYNDKSALWNSKPFNVSFRAEKNLPINKEQISYSSLYKGKEFTTVESFVSYFDELIASKIKDFEKYKISYKNDLKEKVLNSNYKIIGSVDSRINSNLSYNVNTTFPEYVKYKQGEKQTVLVNIVINSANVNLNISLPEFTLKDENLNVKFDGSSSTAETQNNSSSFITVKTFTSYLNDDVNSDFNISRDIAPKSKTTISHSLITNTMSKNMNLENITKKDILNKNLEYGYAVKYLIQNTNIEKTIFDRKKYPYLKLVEDTIKKQ